MPNTLVAEERYIPGVCNIGTRGRIVRLFYGLLGFTVAFFVFEVLQLFPFPHEYRIILVAPIFAGWLGVVEYATSTCVVLAALGRYEMSSLGLFAGVPEMERANAMQHREDLRKALRVLGITTVLTLVTSLLAWFL